MSDMQQIRVTKETHQKMKIMAAAAKMTLQEYLEIVFRDEWAAFQRSEVQYVIMRERIKEQSDD